MSLIDVLDEQGNKTGITKEKSQVHKDGDWHSSAHVWILNSKGQLLIQKRSANKDSYPSMWEVSVGGHVDSGEKSIETVLREVFEEIGLQVNNKDVKFLFRVKKQKIINKRLFIDNEHLDVYLVKKDLEIRQLKLQADEVSEVKWISKKELEEKLRGEDPDFVPKTTQYYDQLFSLI